MSGSFLRRSGRLGYFAVDGDGSIRADQGADGAARAAVLEDISRVIALGGQPGFIQFEHLGWTIGHTEFTPLAKHVVYYNPTFGWHAFASWEICEKSDINRRIFIRLPIMAIYTIRL
jgi:hypothetical protein